MSGSTFSLSALSAKDIARICRVDLTTARRWLRGAHCPPPEALILLELVYTGDLGFLDPAWAGWVLRRGLLCSPENWIATPGAVRAMQLKEAQVRTLTQELMELRVELAALQGKAPWLDEQPTPEQWELATG